MPKDPDLPPLGGRTQRPYRPDGIEAARASWIALSARSEEDAEGLLRQWRLVVSHVANTANESGFFAPLSHDWLVWAAMDDDDSTRLANQLEAAGALTRVDGRLYLAGWRERYRVPYDPAG